jgi:hypothetical protein
VSPGIIQDERSAMMRRTAPSSQRSRMERDPSLRSG